VLSVTNLTLDRIFHDVSFEVRAGEILGVAGLVGSGRSNIAETLFGVSPASSGEIAILGKPIVIDRPTTAMANGMAFLTEDRKETGCFLILDVLENIQIAVLNLGYVKNGFVTQGPLTRDCEAISTQLRIKTPTLQETVLNLSGGNQQKVLIARWLLTKPKILILDEPTRGIDVGAKAEIQKLILDLCARGMAVLFISSELEETVRCSDRVAVLRDREKIAELEGEQISEQSILRTIAGAKA